MKNKILAYAFLPAALSLGIAGSSIASSGWLKPDDNATPEEIAGRYQSVFEREAQLLGISVNELKDAWASGKTMSQMMEEKGITQENLRARMKQARIEQAQVQLKALVTEGVITQSQADKRLEIVKKRADSGKAITNKRLMRGLHV